MSRYSTIRILLSMLCCVMLLCGCKFNLAWRKRIILKKYTLIIFRILSAGVSQWKWNDRGREVNANFSEGRFWYCESFHFCAIIVKESLCSVRMKGVGPITLWNSWIGFISSMKCKKKKKKWSKSFDAI